jgi:hypothetical protein
MELILNTLAEETTKEISKVEDPETLEESKVIGDEGGSIAGDARKAIEKRTNKSVISKTNNLGLAKKKELE